MKMNSYMMTTVVSSLVKKVKRLRPSSVRGRERGMGCWAAAVEFDDMAIEAAVDYPCLRWMWMHSCSYLHCCCNEASTTDGCNHDDYCRAASLSTCSKRLMAAVQLLKAGKLRAVQNKARGICSLLIVCFKGVLEVDSTEPAPLRAVILVRGAMLSGGSLRSVVLSMRRDTRQPGPFDAG